LRVEDDVLAVEVDRREIATAYPPDSTAKTRMAFFVSVNPDDGHMEPQGDVRKGMAIKRGRGQPRARRGDRRTALPCGRGVRSATLSRPRRI